MSNMDLTMDDLLAVDRVITEERMDDLLAVDRVITEEREEARRDIRNSRRKLGEFTLGYFIAAVYGDDYANVYREQVGSDLFETKMSDISIKTQPVNGGVKTSLSEELQQKLNNIKQTDEQKAKINEALDNQMEKIVPDEHDRFNMLKEQEKLAKLELEEKQAALKLARIRKELSERK